MKPLTEVLRDLNGDPVQIPFPPSLGVGRGNIRGFVFADNHCGTPRSEADPACDTVWATTQPRNAGAGVSVNGRATRQGFTGTAGTFDGVRFEVEGEHHRPQRMGLEELEHRRRSRLDQLFQRIDLEFHGGTEALR